MLGAGPVELRLVLVFVFLVSLSYKGVSEQKTVRQKGLSGGVQIKWSGRNSGKGGHLGRAEGDARKQKGDVGTECKGWNRLSKSKREGETKHRGPHKPWMESRQGFVGVGEGVSGRGQGHGDRWDSEFGS